MLTFKKAILVLSGVWLALAGFDTVPALAQTLSIFDLQPGLAMVGSATLFTVRVVYYTGESASCGLYLDGSFVGPMTIAGESAARLHVFSSPGTYLVEARCSQGGGEQRLFGQVVVSAERVSPRGVSINTSRVVMDRQLIPADGQAEARVTVVVRNRLGAPLAGVPVTLRSSRSGLDAMRPDSTVTANDGAAIFFVRSSSLGIGYYVASADGISLSEAPTITFVAPGTSPTGGILPGNLMKLPCPASSGVNDPCRAVYYFGEDRRRHAFPHEKTYYTWYSDFSAVLEVTPDFLSSVALGHSVTYRPGIKLVKFVSQPKVYAVSPGGTLRWMSSEALARELYGPLWNKRIDDISDAFFSDYRFGADILALADYNPSVEADRARTIDQDLATR